MDTLVLTSSPAPRLSVRPAAPVASDGTYHQLDLLQAQANRERAAYLQKAALQAENIAVGANKVLTALYQATYTNTAEMLAIVVELKNKLNAAADAAWVETGQPRECADRADDSAIAHAKDLPDWQ